MSQQDQKVWQIPLTKKPRIECEEMWFHPAITIATDDCIDYINVEKKGRIEMDEAEQNQGFSITGADIQFTSVINNNIIYAPSKKFTLTIEVTARSASEAVALVEHFAKNVKVEEIPQNYYGIQNV